MEVYEEEWVIQGPLRHKNLVNPLPVLRVPQVKSIVIYHEFWDAIELRDQFPDIANLLHRIPIAIGNRKEKSIRKIKGSILDAFRCRTKRLKS